MIAQAMVRVWEVSVSVTVTAMASTAASSHVETAGYLATSSATMGISTTAMVAPRRVWWKEGLNASSRT